MSVCITIETGDGTRNIVGISYTLLPSFNNIARINKQNACIFQWYIWDDDLSHLVVCYSTQKPLRLRTLCCNVAKSDVNPPDRQKSMLASQSLRSNETHERHKNERTPGVIRSLNHRCPRRVAFQTNPGRHSSASSPNRAFSHK